MLLIVLTTLYQANVKMREISHEPKQMLPKRIHLLECKVNEQTNLYEHSIERIEIHTLNTNDEMKNHLLIYDFLILESIFRNG